MCGAGHTPFEVVQAHETGIVMMQSTIVAVIVFNAYYITTSGPYAVIGQPGIAVQTGSTPVIAFY